MKKVSFKKSLAAPSPAVTLSRSKRKKGALGNFSLASLGLFLSLIRSRLKIAWNFEKGWSDRLRWLLRYWSRLPMAGDSALSLL